MNAYLTQEEIEKIPKELLSLFGSVVTYFDIGRSNYIIHYLNGMGQYVLENKFGDISNEKHIIVAQGVDKILEYIKDQMNPKLIVTNSIGNNKTEYPYYHTISAI
jgi:hypothetical protein